MARAELPFYAREWLKTDEEGGLVQKSLGKWKSRLEGSTFAVYYTWAHRFFHSLGKRPDETIVWVRQVEDRKVFADLGVRDVISKPFDPTRIGSQIAAILGWNV